MAAIHNILLFLCNLFFSLCIFVILLRVLLQAFRVNVHNPICQLTAKVTNPVVLPLKKIIPRVYFIDLTSVLILFIIECLKFSFLGWLQNISVGGFFLVVMSLADILLQTINVLFYALIMRVLLSWINVLSNYALNDILYAFTEPLLSNIRRWVPFIAGMDFSPLVAFVVLKILEIIILSYLPG